LLSLALTTQEVYVIDPKINLRSKSAISAQVNNNAGMVLANSAVQTRAYELYELHGRIDGRAEQDWFQAENDLRARSQHA
jgi:Protein of unknown function (DUF2934)